MKSLKQNWLIFLEFYRSYIDDDVNAKVILSREDMRYSYQAGYEQAIADIKAGK